MHNQNAMQVATLEEYQPSPVGLWHYAFRYLKAAKTLDYIEPNPWVVSGVAYQCACQSIELALKSYLCARGFTIEQLIRVGHSLLKCLAETTKAKLRPPLSNEQIDTIALADRYYRKHEFRYIVIGAKDYPDLRPLFQAGAVILDAAAPAVAQGAKKPERLLHRMRVEISESFGATRPPGAIT